MPVKGSSFAVLRKPKLEWRYEKVKGYRPSWVERPSARTFLSIQNGRVDTMKRSRSCLVVEEENGIIVVTVYVFYFGGVQ